MIWVNNIISTENLEWKPDSNEFGFDPKGNRDSLKNFKQGFNLIQFVIY